jgi:hypothetical protein
LIELPPTDNAVLVLCKIPDPAINPGRRNASNRCLDSTRSAFGTNAVLNALLVGHGDDGPGGIHSHGVHFVPKPSRGTQKRPQPAVAASGFDPFK